MSRADGMDDVLTPIVRVLGGYCPDCGVPRTVRYGDDRLPLGAVVRADEARQATCSKCKKPILIQTEPA